MQPVYLADLTWPDVEALLARDNRLLLVTGATEQHGRHLPLGTDNIIPISIAARLSAQSGVPIAPALNYGMSEHHMAFPGTFTLTEDTLKALYLELLQSAYRQGWRRIFVLNGHGGNRQAWEWTAALATKLKQDLKIYLSHWWSEEIVRDFARETVGRTEGHAGLEETAAVLVTRPHLVQLDKAEGHENVSEDVWSLTPEELRVALPLGAIGQNPAEATADFGAQMIDLLVREYLALLEGDWE
ncbi:MAG: creatininase family protein [Chloroflexota bacterium]|nr:creatininase family protein [Chloroflexota bacterium]